MGIMDSRTQFQRRNLQNLQAIEDIYSMFEQSNKVIIAMHNRNSQMTASRIKNIENLLNELLSPFLQQQKYGWAGDIFVKFKKSFTKHFEQVWSANRQQFYELLLINCHVPIDNKKRKSFQEYFYQVAIHKLQQTIPNSYVEHISLQQNNLNVINNSILMNGNNQSDLDLPLFLPQQQQPRPNVEVQMAEFLRQVEQNTSESDHTRQRFQNTSLLLPETVFVDRLSQNSEVQVSDLLKYYNQFVNTANQLFYSNNLISCPLKHFIFSIQQKILRKKIKQTNSLQPQNVSSNEQARKIRKTRELNNNILLYEVKSFLEAYTTFVWMYLQLHLMEDSRLGKIINSEILYGIIFKSVWGFVDWIVDRGFQFEQAKLEDYYRPEQIKNEAKLSNEKIEAYSVLVESLRNERQPQQYLKKVVILYREVSKSCQNADELLLIYEQLLGRSIKAHGSKQLFLFRMRNIIEKLLKIDENSMSGGEISYSWTTWCILIELFREKINYHYGNLVISKGSFNAAPSKETSFAVEESILKNYS